MAESKESQIFIRSFSLTSKDLAINIDVDNIFDSVNGITLSEFIKKAGIENNIIILDSVSDNIECHRNDFNNLEASMKIYNVSIINKDFTFIKKLINNESTTWEIQKI